MSVPTFDLGLFEPGGFSIDPVGTSVVSPRAVSGAASALDFSGGGFWKVEFKQMTLVSPEAHREWCRLSALLTGGVRQIIVPLLTDITMPSVPGLPGWVIDGIPFDDGTVHSDGAGHLSGTVLAEVAADAARGAGTVMIRMTNGATLHGGETFSLLHVTRGWRAYRVTEVDAIDGEVHTVGIRPPLRQEAVAGSLADFWRPRVVMTLPAGVTMPWSPTNWWEFHPDITFVEDMRP